MTVTFSPEIRAGFPELSQPGEPLPLATDQIHREMFVNMHHSGQLDPHRDMIDYMRIVPKEGHTHESIKAAYASARTTEGFDHETFLTAHFDFPVPTDGEKVRYVPGKDLNQHSKEVLLGHVSVAEDGPVTIGLPNPAIASGGRYSDGREGKGIFYYWDQAAIVDSLDALGLDELATGIVDNIRSQIIKYKRPPFNGNAPEYGGRSQPPVYIRMVRRDVRIFGEAAWKKHLPALLIEHAYLMEHATIETPDGGELNVFEAEGFTHEDGSPRYRPESFPAVMKIVSKLRERLLKEENREPTVKEIIEICRQDHSGAGAGTDFSGWMCADGKSLDQLRTTKRAAPFHQALMFELECGIAEGLEACGYEPEANDYKLMAYRRAQTVHNNSYDPATNYYYPYDVDTGMVTLAPTLQDAVFMLESGIALSEREEEMLDFVEENMLTLSGLKASLYKSRLSWDEGVWAYLQQSAATAAWYYDHPSEGPIRENFTKNVQAGRNATGYTIERYAPASSEDQRGKPGGGGEYRAPQRNFAWTDAVDVVLRNRTYRNESEYQAHLRRRAIARGIGIIGITKTAVIEQGPARKQALPVPAN